MKKLSRLLSSGAIALTTAAAASAASVNVYGLLDYGFSLSRFSGAGEQARNEWQLSEKSGMRNSSRFGLRGSENLAPNWSLSFTLESQFLGQNHGGPSWSVKKPHWHHRIGRNGHESLWFGDE